MTSVLIFGDSYVAAADKGRLGFARLAPLFLGWKGTHMGRGGTGFVQASGDRLPYSDRLPALLTKSADVLVTDLRERRALRPRSGSPRSVGLSHRSRR